MFDPKLLNMDTVVGNQIMHLSTAMFLLLLGSFLEYTSHIDRIVLLATLMGAGVFAWASINLQMGHNSFIDG